MNVIFWITLPWLIAIFGAIAYHHAYSGALDMIDNPRLEGFE